MDRNNKMDNVSTSGNVKSTVDGLIKKGFKNSKIPASTIADLRRKYNDDEFIEKIQDEYYEKIDAVRRRAAKFCKLIDRKYGAQGYPLHVVLNKALKYKQKYNLSESEFELFQDLYKRAMSMRKQGDTLEIVVPETNMGKVFGDPSDHNTKLNVNDSELRYLTEIVNMANTPSVRQIHSQIIVQSLTYDELNNPEVRFAKYDSTSGQSRASYIDPVIAAMFLVKIQKFDEYFLFANLAEIIKNKQTGEAPNSFVNYMLLFNLVTEQTDIVCDSSSPLKDIRNRCNLQLQLYQNVLNLRLGKFYDTPTTAVAFGLRAEIDRCRLSNMDSPDYIMFGDESVTLRRLINAFAFRSIMVATTPIQTLTLGVTSFTSPINNIAIVKIPWITVRLPIYPPKDIKAAKKILPSVSLFGNNNTPYLNNHTIEYYLNSVDIATNNGRLETRMQRVMHADGVVIFNVPRRVYQPMVNFNKIFEPSLALIFWVDSPFSYNKTL